MRRYAEKTSVPVEQSRAEIEALVMRAGASEFQSGWMANLASVAFSIHGRRVRFVLTLPNQEAEEFARTPERKKLRSSQERARLWEQACRSRWRALALAIRAKLEAIEVGIATFDDEFLAYLVDPRTDQTISDILRPQLALAYEGARKTLRLAAAGGEE